MHRITSASHPAPTPRAQDGPTTECGGARWRRRFDSRDVRRPRGARGVVDVPMPEPGDGDVLVEVFARESPLSRVRCAAARHRSMAGGVPVGAGPGVRRRGREPVRVPRASGAGPRSWATRRSRCPGDARGRARGTACLAKPARSRGRSPVALRRGHHRWRAVEGLKLGAGDVVVVTAAAGGVGCLAAQFAGRAARRSSARPPRMRFDFIRQFGVVRRRTAPTSRIACEPSGPIDRVPRLPRRSGRGGRRARRAAVARVTTIDWDAVEGPAPYGSTPATSSRSDGSHSSSPSARRSACPSPTCSRSPRWATPTGARPARLAPGKIVLGMKHRRLHGAR